MASGEGKSPAAEWRPSHNPWLIAIAVMLATFMEVLDTSVANVSLPHIAGNLSATTDEATWVLTSYLVANAIILPATNWLGHLFGRKRFLISCIGFSPSPPSSAASPIASASSSSRASSRARPAAPCSRSRRRSCSRVSRRRSAAPPWPSLPWAWSSRRFSGRRWRLDHRQLFLALDLLHQPAHRHPRRSHGQRHDRGPALFETHLR